MNNEHSIKGRCVLVTGAAGTLGSEICRQIAVAGADHLVLLDHSDQALSKLAEQLSGQVVGTNYRLDVCLASVTDRAAIKDVFAAHAFDTVIHAAAYKHVDLVETNAANGICNNLNGTWVVATEAAEHSVKDFLMLSTDKACNPVSVMGASKRAGELCIQLLAEQNPATRFFAVRFCNIYGSSDSVVPKFRQQIVSGGPMTITNRNATRYFIDCDRAVDQMLNCFKVAESGDVLTLTEGVLTKITKLAADLAAQLGVVLDFAGTGNGIPVMFTGLRPGEKLHEELFAANQVRETGKSGIVRSTDRIPDAAILERHLKQIIQSAMEMNAVSAVHGLSQIIPEYQPTNVWQTDDMRDTNERSAC